MMRSSPPPEITITLGKRIREDDDSVGDGNETEPDEAVSLPSTTKRPQSVNPLSNVSAATLRYAAKKKLRPEQCDEVDAFLLVSSLSMYPILRLCLTHQSGYSAWSAGQIICLHPVVRE